VSYQFVVVGISSGEAFSYCRQRWAGEAPSAAYVPLSPFAVKAMAGMLAGARAVLLPGFALRPEAPAFCLAMDRAGVLPPEGQAGWAARPVESFALEPRLTPAEASDLRDLSACLAEKENLLGRSGAYWSGLIGKVLV
jgi:hypothetical protein